MSIKNGQGGPLGSWGRIVCYMLLLWCLDLEGVLEWPHCSGEETEDARRCLHCWSDGELP